MFQEKNLTTNEVLDLLFDDEVDDKNTDEFRVYLEPPVDKNGDTDCDDDDVDDEEIVDPVNPDRLPRGILLSPAEIGLRANKTPQIIGMRGKEIDDKREFTPVKGDTGREDTSNDDSNVERQPQRRGRERTRGATATVCKRRATESSNRGRGGIEKVENDGWSKKDRRQVGTRIPEFHVDENNPNLERLKNLSIDCPLQFYKEIMPDDFIEKVVEQSKLYAEQNKNKSWSKWQNEVTMDNMRVIEGVMLISGYNILPSRRLFWEQRSDTYNSMVAENIR